MCKDAYDPTPTTVQEHNAPDCRKHCWRGTDTSTTEQSNLSALGIRGKQVDDLNMSSRMISLFGGEVEIRLCES